jgi:7,8-dihydropterin-6-yl-methyl-4-(beta-D-ribofuranosyl)aminobenzene 5'-phosphate synthase
VESQGLTIKPAERLEITVLVDNYSDLMLMEQEGVIRRPQVLPLGPLAEHGLSLLVKVLNGDEKHTILLDTGLSEQAMLHNAELLNLNLAEIEALVISHGHCDHFGGLLPLLKLTGPGLKIVCHPEAFNPRRLEEGRETVDLPGLNRGALIAAGGDLYLSKEPSSLADGMVVVLGEVARQTEFERGFPASKALIAGSWQTDPLRDDQGLAVLVEGEGLVVISGCAHAGIINMALHAQKILGQQKVHAILGGFHLSGPDFKPVIEPTIKALQKINPNWLVPMHCTGWQATNELAQAMPQAFLLSTVGTTFIFPKE